MRPIQIVQIFDGCCFHSPSKGYESRCSYLSLADESFESSLPWLRRLCLTLGAISASSLVDLQKTMGVKNVLHLSLQMKDPQQNVHDCPCSHYLILPPHPKHPKKNIRISATISSSPRGLKSVSQAMKTPPKYFWALLRSSLAGGHGWGVCPLEGIGKSSALIHGRFNTQPMIFLLMVFLTNDFPINMINHPILTIIRKIMVKIILSNKGRCSIATFEYWGVSMVFQVR